MYIHWTGTICQNQQNCSFFALISGFFLDLLYSNLFLGFLLLHTFFPSQQRWWWLKTLAWSQTEIRSSADTQQAAFIVEGKTGHAGCNGRFLSCVWVFVKKSPLDNNMRSWRYVWCTCSERNNSRAVPEWVRQPRRLSKPDNKAGSLRGCFHALHCSLAECSPMQSTPLHWWALSKSFAFVISWDYGVLFLFFRYNMRFGGHLSVHSEASLNTRCQFFFFFSLAWALNRKWRRGWVQWSSVLLNNQRSYLFRFSMLE